MGGAYAFLAGWKGGRAGDGWMDGGLLFRLGVSGLDDEELGEMERVVGMRYG